MSSTARLLHKSLFRWMSSIVITCQINSHGNKISGLGFLHNVKRRSSLYCERETWCIEAYERTKSQKRRVHTPTVFKGCRQVYTVAHLMAEKRNRVIHLKDLLLARPYKETKKKRELGDISRNVPIISDKINNLLSIIEQFQRKFDASITRTKRKKPFPVLKPNLSICRIPVFFFYEW